MRMVGTIHLFYAKKIKIKSSTKIISRESKAFDKCHPNLQKYVMRIRHHHLGGASWIFFVVFTHEKNIPKDMLSKQSTSFPWWVKYWPVLPWYLHFRGENNSRGLWLGIPIYGVRGKGSMNIPTDSFRWEE